VYNYADKEWPGNNLQIFIRNRENGKKLDAVVPTIKKECSFEELGFFATQIQIFIRNRNLMP
jgi:Flp pilus assembly protein TadB